MPNKKNAHRTNTTVEAATRMTQSDERKESFTHREQTSNFRRQIGDTASLFKTDLTARALLESLAEGVVVVDPPGHICLFNRRAEEMFLYRAEEIQGQPLAVLLPDRHTSAHIDQILAYFTNPQPRPMGNGFELNAQRKNGEEFLVEISLSHLTTNAGAFGLVLISDISERKNRERELWARNQELEAFAHMVAHDLKSSLTQLIGFGDMLHDEYKSLSEAEIKVSLDFIVKSGRKMNSIILELLHFADLSDAQVEQSQVESKVIINNALQRLTADIQQSGAQIEIPDQLASALGHSPWVEEVWLNYLSNAIKYGGQPPLIQIGSEDQGEFTRFWVTDNGAGLPTQQQAGLFEPFARRHSGDVQGHGLGLSIVKRIVTKLGGTVGAESTPGAGSTFYFTLPNADTA